MDIQVLIFKMGRQFYNKEVTFDDIVQIIPNALIIYRFIQVTGEKPAQKRSWILKSNAYICSIRHCSGSPGFLLKLIVGDKQFWLVSFFHPFTSAEGAGII